jgi:hypothetical protein
MYLKITKKKSSYQTAVTESSMVIADNGMGTKHLCPELSAQVGLKRPLGTNKLHISTIPASQAKQSATNGEVIKVDTHCTTLFSSFNFR